MVNNLPPLQSASPDAQSITSQLVENPNEAQLSNQTPAGLHQCFGSERWNPGLVPTQARLDTCTPNKLPTLSLLQRNVLKCSIAYFIASLFTFCPFLSSLISDLVSYGVGKEVVSTPTGHMVATIAVYFHPAKTVGGMIEADLFCAFGLLYSSFVCLSSMSLFWLLELRPGWEWLGDLVVIIWIGVSMSALAWMKAWMSSPSFNTACSMIAIVIFVVLVKEGGLVTLAQVSAIIVFGSIVSNLTCYIFWPQTATANLEKDIARNLESFSTLFDRLTDTFLLDNDSGSPGMMQEKLHKAVGDHQDSFTKLNKTLNEARSERLYGLWKDYEAVVDSMNRLAQHLNGLRSSTSLQHELTRTGIVSSRPGAADHLNEEIDNHNSAGRPPMVTATALFEELIDDLNPPLKALKAVCLHALRRLHVAFEQLGTKKDIPVTQTNFQEFEELVEAIERALLQFDSTSEYALLRWYKNDESISQPWTSDCNPGSSSNFGGPQSKQYKGQGHDLIPSRGHEVIFLVYFFIFTLQEFARELILLVECIERIHVGNRLKKNSRPLVQAAINFMEKLWKTERSDFSIKRPSIKRSFSHLISMNRRHRPSFPKIQPHAPDTAQTPSWSQLSGMGRLKKLLWMFGKSLVEQRSKYALKAGMAIALLASPAFCDVTRPIFVEYWGDWALISCFIVISPTIGATNNLSMHRLVGTVLGAAVATGIFTLFPNHPVILSLFGFLFSIPCFYYGLSRPPYASASRFVLLTYNLTCLYCYNQRQHDVAVLDIAFRRALAVTAGVVWALLISRLLWPAEARRELGKALGEFCLNLGWLYTRLVASNSIALNHLGGHGDPRTDGSLSSHEETNLRLHNSVKEFMSMELHLQVKLIAIQGLLAQAQHEPRLKGPFPVKLYRNVLTSLQSILDTLHSMRCVTTRAEWRTSVMHEFVIPVNKERREMVGNIILSLSMLACAFHLKAPLPPYLPPCEESRQRLVAAIRKLDVVRSRNIQGSRQLLFFAYAITMKGVTEELDKLGRTLQSAFGVIGHTPETFEALFACEEDPIQNWSYL
ncbi:Fusaric acid resistance protein-like domain containing protein [Amanita muscaria]